MAIKKRKNVPDSSIEASVHDDQPHIDGRNPLLSGLRQDVYQFVKANPRSTRRDVAKGLRLPNNVATARVKELIDEGLLVEPVGVTKVNPSGVRAKVLQISQRPEGGKLLDRVRIEVALTIDCNGIYGAEANVVNGKPQSANTTKILSKKITVTAPHPDTYKSFKSEEIITPVSRHELQSGANDIIDADFIELSD